jgi:hypothetical protein
MIAERHPELERQRRTEIPRPEQAVEVREVEHADWVRNVERWIKDHPALCVGAALALGATIGWLIKRR